MNTVKLAIGMLQNRSRPVGALFCSLRSLRSDYVSSIRGRLWPSRLAQGQD
jgi:hypothetical protein